MEREICEKCGARMDLTNDGCFRNMFGSKCYRYHWECYWCGTKLHIEVECGEIVREEWELSEDDEEDDETDEQAD